jgi:hypothetical protein
MYTCFLYCGYSHILANNRNALKGCGYTYVVGHKRRFIMTLKGKQKILWDEVDRVLWEEWDPIGVHNHEGTRDE